MSKQEQRFSIEKAVTVLNAGGVIAYPTEHCFGLGCDPRNQQAMAKLLKIKRRQRAQGVILIAANLDQINEFSDLNTLTKRADIVESWPGPNTWLLPAKESVSEWVRGDHSTIAMRIPGHTLCVELCDLFGFPIVSTSANRHGQPALLTASDVQQELGDELDYIVDAQVGGARTPSTIRDAISGRVVR